MTAGPLMYAGWLAPAITAVQVSDAVGVNCQLLIWNPRSLHVTFEQALVPFKALVRATDEHAAWTTIESPIVDGSLRRRFCVVWEAGMAGAIHAFIQKYGFEVLVDRRLGRAICHGL
jgi:hypothetical protein